MFEETKWERLPIHGSATESNAAGIVVTRKGAERFARENMPRDLRRAGFAGYVVRGNFVNAWFINYAK